MLDRASRVPLVLQSERDECAIASLTMIARYFGHEVELADLRRLYTHVEHGPSLRSILSLSGSIGLLARPVRLSIADIRRLRLPAILHWEFEHFVVLTDRKRRGVVVHDPAVGRRYISNEELRRSFTGVAVEFTRAGNFRRLRSSRSGAVIEFLRSVRGLGRYLGAMLALLLITQVLSLVPPVAMQLLVDEIVLGQDTDWLYRIVGGVALVMLATVIIDTMRRRIAVYVGMRFAVDTTTSVIDHLLRLRVDAVERRSTGDLISRVNSLQPIRKVITETGLHAVVQCTVIVTTLALMAAYDFRLTALAIATLAVGAVFQHALLRRTQTLNLEAVVASAKANNSLIDSLRSYPSVSALGIAACRLGHWRRHFSTATDARTRIAQLGVFSVAGHGLLHTAEQALFLAMGIAGVVDKRLTLGVLFAFMSLRGRLIGAAAECMAAMRELYLLRQHVDRVGEILIEDAECQDSSPTYRNRLEGRIGCEALSYAYPGGPTILDGVDCRIEPGEWVAICGVSGTGKSTFLRLLATILNPCSGRLSFDGLDVTLWDRDELRRQFGVVQQTDRLLEGSVADNISGFDDTPDLDGIREAASLACVWEDLQVLPMNVHTPLADGGSGLSGGQVQRILLARALYRSPQILFLDEATSHLDGETERRVLDNLASLGKTVVSVSHRRAAIARSDRTLSL